MGKGERKGAELGGDVSAPGYGLMLLDTWGV